MIIIPAFQAGDAGLIPATRSIVLFIFLLESIVNFVHFGCYLISSSKNNFALIVFGLGNKRQKPYWLFLKDGTKYLSFLHTNRSVNKPCPPYNIS